MLQSIRDRTQGWITSTVIGLLIIIFAVWGVRGYLEFNTGKENKIIATVAGQSLSQSDFDKSYKRFYQQARDRLGVGFVVNEKIKAQLKQQTLQQWKVTQVLTQAAAQQKYRISQKSIDSILLNIPAFQSTGRRFSLQHFYDVLNALSYTEIQFLADLKKMLLINQVQQGIIQSAFALPEDMDKSLKFINQKRDFAYLIIPYSKFLAKQFSIPDSQALVYYKENKQDFMQAEQISIEYIELALNKEKNDKAFVAAREKLANLAYIYPDSLDIVSKTLRLSTQSTSFFDRSGGEEAFTKNPKILTAAFSQDVLQGNNSSIIDINSDTVIVLRIKQHKSATVKPYSAVREKIVKLLSKQKAIAKAQEYGENLLKSLAKNSSFVSNMYGYDLNWEIIKQAGRNSKVNTSILRAVFKLNLPNKTIIPAPSLIGVTLQNGDYALVRLIAVHEGENKSLTAQSLRTYRDELAKNFGQLDYDLYAHSLLEKAKLIQY